MNPDSFSYDWQPEKQKQWSEKNFIQYLRRYIYPYSPFYRKRFRELGVNPTGIRNASDIAKLPLTTKEDFKDDVLQFILQPTFPGVEPLYETEKIRKLDLLKYVWRGFRTPVKPAMRDRHRTLRYRIEHAARAEWYPMHVHASGGTTGDPSPAMYTMHDIFNVTPNIACMANLCGLEIQHKCLNLFPAAPHLAFFQVVFSQMLIGGNVFHTCGGSVVPTEKQILLAEKGKFEYIAAIPSYLTYWLDVAKKMQDAGEVGNLDFFLYAVVAGEPMVPAYREKLKRQFAALGSPGCKIIEGYGMTELKGAFYSCDEDSGIHLNAEHYYWEILDPETKNPVPEGEQGVLTFSHAGFRGSALVRYYTGDLVNGLVWDKCPKCGLIGPRLVVPMCRAVKDFSKIKGARVNLLSLQTQVRSTPGVETFQIIITKDNPDDPFSRDWIKIYAAATEGHDPAIIERDIKKNVKLECEITPSEIIFQRAEEIERRLFQRTGLKADWIIDERRMPGQPAAPHPAKQETPGE